LKKKSVASEGEKFSSTLKIQKSTRRRKRNRKRKGEYSYHREFGKFVESNRFRRAEEEKPKGEKAVSKTKNLAT